MLELRYVCVSNLHEIGKILRIVRGISDGGLRCVCDICIKDRKNCKNCKRNFKGPLSVCVCVCECVYWLRIVRHKNCNTYKRKLGCSACAVCFINVYNGGKIVRIVRGISGGLCV